MQDPMVGALMYYAENAGNYGRHAECNELREAAQKLRDAANVAKAKDAVWAALDEVLKRFKLYVGPENAFDVRLIAVAEAILRDNEFVGKKF